MIVTDDGTSVVAYVPLSGRHLVHAHLNLL
jgi:hypothetical protein